MPRWSCVEMKPGCCFMNAASDAQACCSWSASSGSTVKVLIRITEPTCWCSICSKSDTCLSISTSCGICVCLLWGSSVLSILRASCHPREQCALSEAYLSFSPEGVEQEFCELRLHRSTCPLMYRRGGLPAKMHLRNTLRRPPWSREGSSEHDGRG